MGTRRELPAGLLAVLPALRCPVCEAGLAPGAGPARSVTCADGHVVDLARQGSLNLSGGRPLPAGDTAAMVAARQEFLATGHYAPIADAVADAVARHAPEGLVVDLGGGTGQYLAHVLDAVPAAHGICLDTSTPAVHRAARSHPRVAAVAADAWRALPVQDGCAAAVLGIFAPRNPVEVRRVLGPDGVWVVVTPHPEHLAELVGPLGMIAVDPRKEERLAEEFRGWATLERRDVVVVRELGHADLRALVEMGPSAHHVTAEDLRGRVAALADPTPVTLAVRVTTLRPT
ncbi:methyltransferase domain-containing protein [Kineococcus gynurae]|uniref:Methyltransferase domain-containing protein n=1 Tax=Kineococcus gynurae TaxID=452979 RepID=A0ABV5LQ08_9ACTN